MPNNKYVKGKDGKFKGSVGAGKKGVVAPKPVRKSKVDSQPKSHMVSRDPNRRIPVMFERFALLMAAKRGIQVKQ